MADDVNLPDPLYSYDGANDACPSLERYLQLPYKMTISPLVTARLPIAEAQMKTTKASTRISRPNPSPKLVKNSTKITRATTAMPTKRWQMPMMTATPTAMPRTSRSSWNARRRSKKCRSHEPASRQLKRQLRRVQEAVTRIALSTWPPQAFQQSSILTRER